MKDKCYVVTFFIILYGFVLLFFFLPKENISWTEKRYLKKFPTFSYSSDYVNEVDAYVLDHFPGRDFLRSVKSYSNYFIFRKIENNDLVLYKDGIYKTSKTNKKAIDYYFHTILNTKNLFPSDASFYSVLVPDKNYYLDIPFLTMDYEYIYSQKIDGVKSIDIRDLLSFNHYYLTDTHWKQEMLLPALHFILENMGIIPEDISYEEHIYSDFKGVYYGESATFGKRDTLVYLTNEDILNAHVTYFENEDLTTVYNEDNLESFDSYEVFLDGASAYIEIENEHSRTNRELLVFRDSFGSSIIPLFIPYFRKITVIDNRYIPSSMYTEMISLEHPDILFLNSTLLVNDSFALKN